MTTQSPANGFRVTLITRLSRPDENRVSLEKNIRFGGFAVGVAPSIPWVEVASNLTSSALQGVGLAKVGGRGMSWSTPESPGHDCVHFCSQALPGS